MKFLKALNNSSLIPSINARGTSLPEIEGRQANILMGFNNGVTLYPQANDLFIKKGYNKNAFVYSIVAKLAKKFGQVPFYHYRIKVNERKTWHDEYLPLTKNIGDARAVAELKRMRTKAIDSEKLDSPLQRLLNKPNRNQTGAQFREQLYGYKLLSGEGNTYLSRLATTDKPNELFIIPKAFLAHVKGADMLADIAGWKLLLGGNEQPVDKKDIILWAFPNYEFDPVNLSHLRGAAPLNAGALMLQASNEGEIRKIAMNKNQGVAGLAFNKSISQEINVEQAMFQRKQFNSIVNDQDLAGSIAVMNGEWGYLQFGLDAGQLKLIEQSDADFKTFCNIFDIPWQLFGNNDAYENRKQYKRDFIYDNIAPAAYGYRDELNAKLIPEMNLDRERDVIDCDIVSLPELAEDLKTQVTALKDAYGLTVDQRLEAMGYDAIGGEMGEMRLVPQGLTTLKDINSETGVSLDNEMSVLNRE